MSSSTFSSYFLPASMLKMVINLYLALDFESSIYILGLAPPELKDDEIPVLTLSNAAGSSKDFPINHKMNLEEVLDVPDISSKKY